MSNSPKHTKGDTAHALTKGAIGMMPIVGALASEIFGLVITPPLEKRRIEWMNDVAEKLKKLEDEKVLDIASLKDNNEFIDVVLQATTLALKTSDEEKIKSFKNALLRSAAGEAPDTTKTHIFLRLVDEFTSWHIRILKLMDDPIGWFKQASLQPPGLLSGTISGTITTAFPELKGQDDLVDIVWNDLYNAGFHRTNGTKTMMTADGALASKTTTIGAEFLDFISDLG